MKQICYLAPEYRLQRFDALFSELDIVVQPQDIGKVQSLVAFIQREKTLHQMDLILLDLSECAYSEEHILSAVQLLRRFSIAELLFIAPAGEETSLLYGRLAAFRVSGLIAVERGTDVEAELRSCLLDEGGNFHRRASALSGGLSAAASREASPLRIPAGLVIRVAVAGTQSRVGVTTQCFALFHYLKSLGFHPAILDGERRTLGLLEDLYSEEVEQREGYCAIRGILFCTQMVEGLNAYILDLGVLQAGNAGVFAAQDLPVLVTGAKPWELPHLAAAIQLLGEAPKQLAALVSFATQGDLAEMSAYLGDHAANAAYHPDLWTAGSASPYRAAILPCLQKICGGGDG